MTGQPPEDRAEAEAVEIAAITRFARLRGGGREAVDEHDKFARLPVAEAQRAAFEDVGRLWDELEDLRSDPAILAAREEALAQLSGWRSLWRHPAVSRAVAACCALLLVAGGAWTAIRTGNETIRPAVVHQFNTRVGQISGVALPDGSLAILDTGTTIRFHNGRRNEREVDLVDGRALFKVAKIPDRPFRVAVGETTLTALGTKFDVLRTAHGFNVNLVEGKLRVARDLQSEGGDSTQEQQLVMLAGDRLTVTPGRWLLSRGIAAGSVDWAKGQLVFDNAPVAEVVAMLNRYTLRKIRVADAGLAAQRISAVIRTDDPLMLVDALTAMGIGRGRATGDGMDLVPL